ncbi:TonB-dependent receptor [Pedobacter panaciterrae]|uniref:TonB-dependent receptor n=1 Tax=Pedobacter panaciterrae TaxID=363849 RepID=A0ABU8NMI2_9SPHI
MKIYDLFRAKLWAFSTMQLFRIMRLTVIIITACFLQISAASKAQVISLNEKNASLETIINKIIDQTNYSFIGDTKLIRLAKPIDINVQNVSIEKVLSLCFTNQPMDYSITDKTVVIRKKEKQSIVDIKITGVVTDSTGTTLPGVSVVVKGTAKGAGIGAVTNTDGKYVLNVPDGAKVLIFSSVGMKSQEVEINGRTIINVTLKSADAQLDDVVVVAFGKQKKTEVVGSMTTIKPADLKIPSSNLTAALAGKLAGVIAYQRSGEPGADNADFFVRGVTTFGYKVSPLILVDGIESTSTDLARLQVDDIASFSIMKDATSTALYGARGANGVILITTKEGKEGKVNLSFRAENSLSQSTRDVEFADPVTYMTLANEANLTRNPLGGYLYQQSKIDNTIRGTDPVAYPTTDWQKMLLKDYTMNQRYNLNVNGGGKVARYFVAGALSQDHGIMKVDPMNNFNSNANLKTYSLRSNVNINLTKTTELITRISGVFDDYRGPINSGTAIYNEIVNANPVLFPARYAPTEDTRFVRHIMFGNYGDGQFNNPYASLQKGYKDYSQSTMSAQLQLSQDFSFITEGLSARAMVNTQRYAFFDVSRFYNPYYYSLSNYDRVNKTYSLRGLNELQSTISGVPAGTEYLGYDEGEKKVSTSFYSEAALNYKRTFNQVHSLSGMLIGIAKSSLTGGAGDLQSSLPFRNMGLSGRFTYVYNDRYATEFNFGYNGSERFHSSHRFGFFPSAGVAYTVSNEDFWKPLKEVMPTLKLRATYGLVGNDQIGSPEDRFFYLSNVNMNSTSNGAVFGTLTDNFLSGVDITRYANNDITWETAKKFNFGIESNLFNKLGIQVDIYKERRTNILMDRTSIPSTMGLSANVRANVGEASSHGVDVSMDYSQNIGSDIWIKGMANFTYATSKFEVYEEPEYAEKNKSHVGYSLSQNWGYIAERLFVDDNDVAYSPKQNFGIYGAGDIKYRDVNHDGQITSLDQVPIGFPTSPEIVYGFGLSAGYKRFDLSCFFQGLGRESFWIDGIKTSPFVNNQGALLKAYADNHWSEENRNIYALWPRLSTTVNVNNTQTSTWLMQNGAFLRLKSLELGYTLPNRITQKAHMSNVRFYLNGTNLFLWSNFKLWDVEMGGNGLGYPVQRVMNLGVLISIN